MGGCGALGLQLNPPMSSCCFNYSWTSTRGSHCSKRWRGIFARGAWAQKVMKKTKKTRIFRVSPQSHSPFSPSLQAFPSSARERVLNLINSRSKGWRSGESARLPPMWHGFKSRRRRYSGLSLLLVLSFAPRGFSPVTPVFPSPQKPTFPNSNSTRNQVDEEPLCGCATSKSLVIYVIFIKSS